MENSKPVEQKKEGEGKTPDLNSDRNISPSCREAVLRLWKPRVSPRPPARRMPVQM